MKSPLQTQSPPSEETEKTPTDWAEQLALHLNLMQNICEVPTLIPKAAEANHEKFS
jgi:hypothetical protein